MTTRSFSVEGKKLSLSGFGNARESLGHVPLDLHVAPFQSDIFRFAHTNWLTPAGYSVSSEVLLPRPGIS